MLLKADPANMAKTAKTKIFDAAGRKIPFCVSYDTDTKEIEMIIQVTGIGDLNPSFLVSEGNIVKVKMILPDSYAEVDGKRL